MVREDQWSLSLADSSYSLLLCFSIKFQKDERRRFPLRCLTWLSARHGEHCCMA